MNIYKITYDTSGEWRCVMANNVTEAIDIFNKEVNKFRKIPVKIIAVETIATNIIYNVSKIEKDSYNEGYKDGIDNFYSDIIVTYNNLK